MNSYHPFEDKALGKKIGEKLRQIRINRGLSMEALAKQIQISKPTLGQIERGEANPTLSVLWKIAHGLSIPITSLLAVENDVAIARKNEGLKLTSQDQAFVVEPLFTHPPNSFELYRGYLKPYGEYQSEAHPAGVIEMVTVMTGKLVIELEGKRYELDEHDSIRFYADCHHKYINPTSHPAILHFVIAYHGSMANQTLLFSKNK
ncbi:helix-turn-helix domain-containing protein [Thermoflavimicrobium dichotomicum]|uniref:Cupin domain-containing protein n=1 Tax=Thermoflavimicrobium dichotomicum TaxID=46223 RepID=A0A1I3P101_9BACL|nr:XRE family transcriptional regulator [Thermoflavimicrobium dichotomicum]SFJ15245.1 Cupin domain-containing protein [Thermoflavimicrobium dichotomicum]